jgi:U3 small nucleolar RNA-associated protein 21
VLTLFPHLNACVPAGGRLPGWGDDDDSDAEAAAAPQPRPSRVRRAEGAAAGPAGGGLGAGSAFQRLLRAGRAGGDYTSFMAALRGMSPAAVDRELRALTLLGGNGETDAEVEDLAALLQCLEWELAAGRSFEFCAALLQHTLGLHGEAIMAHGGLQAAAARLRGRMAEGWARVGDLLQSVRCAVDFYSNTV